MNDNVMDNFQGPDIFHRRCHGVLVGDTTVYPRKTNVMNGTGDDIFITVI